MLAHPKARFLRAAERQLVLDASGRQVDGNQAGLDPVDELVDAGQVVGNDGRRKSKLDAIGEAHGVVKIVRDHQGQHGSEDFLLGDAHFGRDAGKDGRLDEVAFVVGAAGEAVAAAEQLGAFLLRDLNILQVSLELVRVHRRADVDAGLEPVAHFQSAGLGNELLNQRLVDGLLDDGATASGALLAGRKERAIHQDVRGVVEVRILEDHGGILAAHLELDSNLPPVHLFV